MTIDVSKAGAVANNAIRDSCETTSNSLEAFVNQLF